jgi:hypothetical protein
VVNNTPAAAPSTSSAPPVPLTCAQKMHDWANGGGTTDITTVAGDLGQFSQDAPTAAASGDYSTVEADMTAVSNDAQTLADNLPPRCVANGALTYNIKRAMGEFEASNVAFQVGAASLNASLIDEATSFMAKGTAFLAKATSNVNRFNQSNG